VLLDPDWNPANDVQAMGRVYRQGQTRPTFIYRVFLAGTIEEVIYQRQLQKGNLATLTVDGVCEKSSASGGGADTTSMTDEELNECFTLKEHCDCDTRRKVGSHWKDYDGPESLSSQGCLDLPLIDVAELSASILGFVRVVVDDDDDNDSKMPSRDVALAAASVPSSLYDSDKEDEFEFSEDDDEDEKDTSYGNNNKPGLLKSLCDSGEESEFEF